MKALYTGASPFLLTYTTFLSCQFTIYEYLMRQFKISYTPNNFREKEMQFNVIASFTAGCVAAAVTNPLECITVNK